MTDLTFNDDPSQMLREVRFASCKKLTLSKRVKESILDNKSEIQRVPKELIHKEFEKGASCDGYFETLYDLGLLTEIIPELQSLENLPQHLKFHTKDVMKHTLATLQYLPKDGNLKMAMLLHDIGKPETFSIDEEGIIHNFKHWDISAQKSESILDRLKYPKSDKDHIKKLIQNHHLLHNLSNQDQRTEKALKKVVREYNDLLPEIESMTRADILSDNPHSKQAIYEVDTLMADITKIKSENTQLNQFKLAITGTDIANAGFKGPDIGIMKKKLEDMVLNNEISNDRNILLTKLKK